MRKLASLLLLALLGACSSAGEGPPRKVWPDDAEAAKHFEEGAALFAAAETAAVPSETLVKALAAFEAASKAQPRAEYRFAHARTALMLAPDDAKAKTELAACVEEEPGEPRFRALFALSEASLDDAERALDLAATAALGSAQRCLVGDLVMLTVRSAVPRTIAQADQRGRLTLRASELGSPDALVFSARLHWLARKAPIMDWPLARAQAQEAAETHFTKEERGAALLWRTETAARMGARELGHMYVEDGDFTQALPWLEKGLTTSDDLVDPQAVVATAELGCIEAFGLTGMFAARGRAENGLERLRIAGDLGFTPAMVRRAWLDEANRGELLRVAQKKGSPGAFAAAGDFEKLLALLEAQQGEARTDIERLPSQRLIFFVRALLKGGAVRTETENAAREAVEHAPENTSVPVARQFRHIAGDLSADELQRTMPRSAHVPRWRAETELALATRCLLLADREGARAHLKRLRDARALFTPDDEIAWGALRLLEKK